MTTASARSVLGNECQVLIGRLHGREQQHLLNVALVGEEHGKSVNAKTKATRWRKTVLESSHKGIVHDHGFVVALLALRSLFDETLVLHNGIVQLCVGVGELYIIERGNGE